MGDLLVDCPLVVTPVGLEFEMNFQLGRVLQNQELGVGGVALFSEGEAQSPVPGLLGAEHLTCLPAQEVKAEEKLRVRGTKP